MIRAAVPKPLTTRLRMSSASIDTAAEDREQHDLATFAASVSSVGATTLAGSN